MVNNIKVFVDSKYIIFLNDFLGFVVDGFKD